MLSLTIVVLGTMAVGLIIWANDQRHASYGLGLPTGVATAVGAMSWIVMITAGLGYRPGLTWIPWILPVLLGAAAAVGAVLVLGRKRSQQDTRRLTAALKL